MTQPATRAYSVASALTRYEGPLLRYAGRLLSNPDRARDVVQETFLKLCREDLARLDGHLAQWLFRVCRNHALDVIKKEGRHHALEDSDLREQASPAPTPARVLEGREALQAVREALATLPASQQEVLRLKFQEGLSYREISTVTGRTINHVGVLIHNGLKTLRQRLAETECRTRGPRR